MKQETKNCIRNLNLGSGEEYREGFINLDFNNNIKADVYWNIEDEFGLPFRNNRFDYILCSHVLEHVKDLYKLMDELYRISSNGATIEIISPHFTSTWANKEISHYQNFGVGTFANMTAARDCGQVYGKANFIVIEEELRLFFNFYKTSEVFTKIARFFNHFNFLFNFTYTWQNLCERFQLFGFDEIYYKLIVVKNGNKQTNIRYL